MNLLFVHYPNCGTCKKAKKWLEDNNINFTERHMVDENPTFEELKEWFFKSKLPLKKFFNTSGKKYKEKNLKNILPDLDDAEMLSVLASDGMLVKRPIVVLCDKVLVGFKQIEWEETLL